MVMDLLENTAMKIIDPGHQYELLSLDGDHKQTLQFVKRCDFKNPTRFPGNTNSYPGTTLQDVIHCLLDRVRYLNNQIPCIENTIIVNNLQQCLFLLESRAARRHGINFTPLTLGEVESLKLCPTCGHTTCHCNYPHEDDLIVDEIGAMPK